MKKFKKSASIILAVILICATIVVPTISANALTTSNMASLSIYNVDENNNAIIGAKWQIYSSDGRLMKFQINNTSLYTNYEANPHGTVYTELEGGASVWNDGLTQVSSMYYGTYYLYEYEYPTSDDNVYYSSSLDEDNMKLITCEDGIQRNCYKIVIDDSTVVMDRTTVQIHNTLEPTTQPTTEATQPTTATSKKTTITLAKSSASIYVKGTAKINATVKNGKGTTTYSSSNTKVAKVDKNGKVTAIKKGTATITVKNNKVSKTFKVTVKNPKIGNDLVVLSLQKGNKTTTLKIIGQIGKATFTSSNKKVATVNSSGKITAKKVGKAIITIKTNGVKLKCYMQVVKSNEAPDLEWLSLSD
jgi:uncharacterized protein YjdB